MLSVFSPSYRPISITAVLLATALLAIGCASPSGVRDDEPLPPGDLLSRYDTDLVSCLAMVNEELASEPIRYEELADNLTAPMMTFSGSHYDLGYALGIVIREHGRPIRRLQSPDRERNQKIRAMYERIYPQYLELITGVAEANGLQADEIDLTWAEHSLFITTWWDLLDYNEFSDRADFSPSNSCSVVALQTADSGDVIVGRNFDGASYRPHFIVSSEMDEGYRVLGNSCYAPYHWVSDGINEHGLFAGVSTNGHPEHYNYRDLRYPTEPAVQVIHMVRICLETCRTVEEAAELFGSVRIWFSNEVNHILLADSSGAMAVVEFDRSRTATIFRTEDPYMVLTNSAYHEGETYLTENCRRYREAMKWLDRHHQKTDDIRPLIESIQLHGSGRTLWTSIFNLNTLTMEVGLREERFRIYHGFSL